MNFPGAPPLSLIDISKGREPTRGGGHFTGVVSGTPERIPSPQDAPKHLVDVRIGEGTRGQTVETSPLEGYRLDRSFGIQQISFLFHGVQEGARDALLRHLGGR